ncbi:hypothetical protein PENTCL1PPCAC_5749, partial [Pristionchus entomophagus]
ANLTMLRKLTPIVCRVQIRHRSLPPPIISQGDAKRKNVDDLLGITQPKVDYIKTEEEPNKAASISGVPEEHQYDRTARIFKPTREATQQGWNNTKGWRIELDNRGRWENPLIGWASSGDPLSNLSMHLKFGSKEDAIAFCVNNNWEYEVEEPQERQIKPKSYGSIYSWDKRFRVSTK